MDTLLALAALVILASVPTLLGLIYLELRQRRMFGSRTIVSANHHNGDTAAIAMTVQAELERLRADVHSALTSVSTDIERVREHVTNREPAGIADHMGSATMQPARHVAEQGVAIAELYSALSKLDVAFLAVTRPVLLPGEEFDGEEDLPIEAFRWESWNDVGAAAYRFAEVFSERRINLDQATREQLNATITSIRRCLTTQLYPVLSDRDGSIGEEHRLTVAQVVSTIASDIRDGRAVLEHATLPGA
jgi:hypothetical protein